MTFDEYEKSANLIYREFAERVAFVLAQAISAEELTEPQALKFREKAPDSLRKRLLENQKIDSDRIEDERKDLAGVRLIFYTDTQVTQFNNSGIVFRNFTVEPESTKFHYPTPENKNRRYQAQHFIVRFSDDRLKLPEYAKFKGMRCEVQVHTILNHAWSETSHDIYKYERREGFANKAMESIAKRLDRVMDKYLMPAGREFARIQHDYERLKQGRALFDADIWQLLETAPDNNLRHELLTRLRDELLPNYDDLRPIYCDFLPKIANAMKAARVTETVARKTPFGSFEGNEPKDVILRGLDILESYRYLDIDGTFNSLCDFYCEEPDADVRKKVLEAVEHLAQYNIGIWNQVGPYVQSRLLELIGDLKGADRAKVRSVIIAVCEGLLSSEISGTNWTSSAVQLSFGSVPVTDQVRRIRQEALELLYELFKTAIEEGEKRRIFVALHEAASVRHPSDDLSEMLSVALDGSASVTDFLTANVANQPYALLQTIEHSLLLDFRRAGPIALADSDEFSCKENASKALAAIERFRDTVNCDEDYVRYKVLVGFDSVYPPHWVDDEFDYTPEEEKYRNTKISEFIAEIDESNEHEWLALLEKCALTRSDDLATFPAFTRFIVELSRLKPEVTDRMLRQSSSNLLEFLAAFLDGLLRSERTDLYEAALQRQMVAETKLWAIARHWRNSKPGRSSFAVALLQKAMQLEDDVAVIELTVFAMQADANVEVPSPNEFLYPALIWLKKRNDTRWVSVAPYWNESKSFFETISTDNAKLLLGHLVELRHINNPAERFLSLVAKSQPQAVWDYIGKRLARCKCDSDETQYQDVPYRLNKLSRVLQDDVTLAIDTARAWHADDSSLFKYRGGRFLSAVFPQWRGEFARQMAELVREGTDEDSNFVMAVLGNYSAEHLPEALLKAIIVKYPNDRARHAQVRDRIGSIDGVWGAYGIVNSFRARRDRIKAWCDDEHEAVREFATAYVRSLELQIALEHKRADDDQLGREEADDEGENN
jgi:ppGpp synthetase/RelA/SpoT-type nucleotidyltranferase